MPTKNTYFFKTLQSKSHRKLSGFTLVELIVVITILTILGTIAFTQLWEYSSSARDSARIENLTNLQKGLTLFQIRSGTYPIPENPVNITASGTIIGYQWFAKDQIADIAKLSKGGTQDPSDTTIFTTYSVNTDRSKMQIMAFLEDSTTATAFNTLPDSFQITQAFASTASDYSKRTPITKGDTIGILLGNTGTTLNQPVQESGTGVDVVNTNTGYAAVFGKGNSLNGTGLVLKSMRAGGEFANGLIGYWSFDESGTLITDNSWKWNTATCYYTTGSTVNCGTPWQWPQFVSGKVWLAMSWAGLKISPFPDLKSKNLTISFWLKSTNTNTGYLDIINQWDCSSGSCQVANEAPWWFWIQNAAPYFKNPVFISNWNGWNNGMNPINWNYNLPIQWDNGWHFFVIGKMNTVISLYMDGVKFASQKNTIETIDTNFPLYILKSWHTNDNPVGLVDEVRIYNRALSNLEIQTLYNATK